MCDTACDWCHACISVASDAAKYPRQTISWYCTHTHDNFGALPCMRFCFGLTWPENSRHGIKIDAKTGVCHVVTVKRKMRGAHLEDLLGIQSRAFERRNWGGVSVCLFSGNMLLFCAISMALICFPSRQGQEIECVLLFCTREQCILPPPLPVFVRLSGREFIIITSFLHSLITGCMSFWAIESRVDFGQRLGFVEMRWDEGDGLWLWVLLQTSLRRDYQSDLCLPPPPQMHYVNSTSKAKLNCEHCRHRGGEVWWKKAWMKKNSIQ